MKTYKSIILICIVFFSNIIHAQFTNFDCGTTPAGSESVSSPFEGYSKPNRTDSLNGSALVSDAIFPVLVVFVQFKNEASDPRHTWDTNSAPVYLDDLIADEKQTSSEWWNSYDEIMKY